MSIRTGSLFFYLKYSCARCAALLMQSRSSSSVSNFLLGLRYAWNSTTGSVPYRSPEKPGIKVSQVTLVASSFTVGRLPRPVAEGYQVPFTSVRVI